MGLEPGFLNTNTQDGWINMVTFRLDHQIYGIRIEPIRQIIEMVKITPIPQLKGFIEGVINFHGAAVPVISMRRHLCLPEEEFQLDTPIILATIAGRMVGLVVDEVMDVQNQPPDNLTRPRDILPDEFGETPLLQGLLQTKDGTVILLDLDHLFAPQQASLLTAAADIFTAETEGQNTEALELPEDDR